MQTKKPSAILTYFNPDGVSQDQYTIAHALNVLATSIDELLPATAEKSAGMRKLLEARDCFMRAIDTKSSGE